MALSYVNTAFSRVADDSVRELAECNEELWGTVYWDKFYKLVVSLAHEIDDEPRFQDMLEASGYVMEQIVRTRRDLEISSLVKKLRRQCQDILVEYGLDYGKTVDLACSIYDRHLHRHMLLRNLVHELLADGI